MRSLNTVWTLSRIVFHILRYLGLMLIQALRHGRHWSLSNSGKQAIQTWAKQLCAILKIDIQLQGEPPTQTVLLVSNHISWLDILALATLYPYSFLSKSELRRWPVIGFIAASSGTLFIKRHSVSGLKHALRDVTRRLQQGRSVCLFPEGTTIANGMNPFKSGLFDTALQAGVPIQPVAIEYLQDDAAYVDDDHFVSHLIRQAGKQTIHVKLHFLPMLEARGDRRELARQAQAMIAAELTTPLPGDPAGDRAA